MNFQEIFSKGSFYRPAYKHYSTFYVAKIEVMCDRCKASNINSCFGYKNFDICLSCAAYLEREQITETTKPTPVEESV